MKISIHNRFAPILPLAVALLVAFSSNSWAVILSDNTSRTTAGVETATTTRWLAASFSTDASSYYLTSVTLLLANTSPGAASLYLYSEGGLEPGSLIAALTSPGSYSGTPAATTFTSAGTPLLPSTTYWLVLVPASGTFTWSWTADNTGDGAGFLHTWGDTSDSGASWYSCDNYATQFTVNASTTVPVTDGDMNCDGLVNILDADPFALALTDPNGYAAAFPSCDINRADMNNDNVNDGLDTQGFVAALLAP
jgi:hypothetical protein